MDPAKGKGKKNLIVKTWERCKSMKGFRGSFLSKSRSWSYGTKDRQQIAREGYFSVYVGQEKQRFVVKTKCANHPLFRMLLEDAEMEYGHSGQGPILLPCEVDLFFKVVAEMEREKVSSSRSSPVWGFGYGGCSPFSPSRRLGNSEMAKGYSSYGLLTPSRLLRLN